MQMAETEDYCTAVPDRFNSYDMSGCCKIHDEDYENQSGRWEADCYFYKCLKQTTCLPIALVYFIGVRLFGWYPYWKHGRRKDLS